MLGKLTLDAFVHGPIETGAQLAVVFGALITVALLLYTRRLGWLWREWLTSLDAKKIGVMYLVLAGVMGARGFADAVMMRSQQALATAPGTGFLPPDHFAQIFTAHGVIMIFFVAMPLIFGLLNLIVPLQIGARDVAYPFLNSVSLWLTVAGAMLANLSLVAGAFAATGWLAYPPLSELMYSPGVGVDYYIWTLQIAGVGSLLSGVNFLVTIIKMRAPGMTLMRMPIFVWTSMGSMLLVIFAFPILTVALALLSLDRVLGMHFFTTDLGGSAMMYVNLIWAWGHPEVYILVLPAFGIFSELVPVFSQKKLFGYTSMVVATMSIVVLSFLVWVHHFFTMGAGANVNAFFGIMTMAISIPTGVKIFNWLFTMFRGRIRFLTPMLWFMGFLISFTIGGVTGVLMSIPAADFQLHNSLFLVAHFHNMIIGGVLWGAFAGLTYWFPKVTGYMLNEKLGVYSFWAWVVGFCVTFLPLYALGIMGMTRRLDYVDAASGWHPLLLLSAAGVAIIALAIGLQVLQVAVSLRRKEPADNDPWKSGRTLEWSTTSPAPGYNFAVIPQVHSRDAWWESKNGANDARQEGKAWPSGLERPLGEHRERTREIEMPRNTAVGMYIAFFAFCFGFGMIWNVWWLAAAGILAAILCVITRSFDENIEQTIHI